MKDIRIGIAGVGGRGRRLAEAIRSSGTGRVVAFADPDPRSREAAARLVESARPFDDWREMLDSAELDILVVSAPQHLHAEMTEAGIQRGLDIYCEKPLAPNLHDCDRIVEAVRTSDSTFYVGLQMRTMPLYRKVHDLIEQGAIGQPRLVVYREMRGPFLPKVENWLADEAKSGGALVEKNCHHFDLFNWLTASRANRLFALGGRAITSGDGNPGTLLDHALVLVEYANDAQACLEICFFSPVPTHELEVVGDMGRIVASQKTVYYYPRRSASPADGNPGQSWTFPYASAHGDDDAWADFMNARAIRPAREQSLARALAARESVRLGLAAEESVRSHSVVHLD